MTLEERIRDELRQYPTERVDQFLARLRTLWQLAKTAPKPPTDAERLKKLQRLKAACDEFLGAAIAADSALYKGEPIGREVGRLARTSTEPEQGAIRIGSILDRYIAGDEATASFSGDGLDEARERVMQLRENLSHLIGRLEQSERRGRQGADADGVLAEIARIYQEILGESPTTTMGGPFTNIVALLLDQNNVERPVRAAVAALTK